MSTEELFKLRREVRRDDDISDKAQRLFAEIVDLHQLSKGCIAQDTTLSDYLGCTPRTIARRRDELVEAGYLREDCSAKNRILVPKWPNQPNEQGETLPDKFDETPDTNDETGDNRDGGAPDKSDVHREKYTPPDVGESARVKDRDNEGVEIWVDVTGERPTIQAQLELKQYFEHEAPRWDPEAFRSVLREAFVNVDRDAHRIKLGYLESAYEKELEHDTNMAVTEDGKLKGSPEPNAEYNARGYRIN